MGNETDPTIYKIISRTEWELAKTNGVFHGAAVDIADGFIHFSTATQATETAAKHFAGQSDLLLVGIPSAALGEPLKWEPSRGGQLFPHLYGSLDTALASSEDELPLGENGLHQFPW